MTARASKAKVEPVTVPVLQPEVILTQHEPTAVAIHEITARLESVERIQKEILEHLRRSFPSTFRRIGA